MNAAAVHHCVDEPDPPRANAPVLVLSHSLGATLKMWDPQVASLRRYFRVVRYDLRGHGLSPPVSRSCDMADLAADLVGLIDRIGAARAHLCGLSIGGMISLWVAAHHRERVDRLVVCSAAAHFDRTPAWAERARLVRANGTSFVADAVVDRWFTPEFRGRHPEIVEAMRATIAATSGPGYAACCDAIDRMDLRPLLGAICAPTLAIAAADDPATPPNCSYEIARAIPGSRVEIVDRAAHLVNVEQPEQVSELIVSHLIAGGAAKPAPSNTKEKA